MVRVVEVVFIKNCFVKDFFPGVRLSGTIVCTFPCYRKWSNVCGYVNEISCHIHFPLTSISKLSSLSTPFTSIYSITVAAPYRFSHSITKPDLTEHKKNHFCHHLNLSKVTFQKKISLSINICTATYQFLFNPLVTGYFYLLPIPFLLSEI